jgi:hypothetical protein
MQKNGHRSGKEINLFLQPEFEPQTVQSVAWSAHRLHGRQRAVVRVLECDRLMAVQRSERVSLPAALCSWQCQGPRMLQRYRAADSGRWKRQGRFV